MQKRRPLQLSPRQPPPNAYARSTCYGKRQSSPRRRRKNNVCRRVCRNKVMGINAFRQQQTLNAGRAAIVTPLQEQHAVVKTSFFVLPLYCGGKAGGA